MNILGIYIRDNGHSIFYNIDKGNLELHNWYLNERPNCYIVRNNKLYYFLGRLG